MASRKIKASFFLTGHFYENEKFRPLVKRLIRQGHFIGPHSYDHLLYCDWIKRDSLLVTHQLFTNDLTKNIRVIASYGQSVGFPNFFMPPYEWYNDTISSWTKDLGIQLINYSPGTMSTADYTTPGMKNYRSSEVIWKSIMDKESHSPSGLNGFILLVHIGTDPARKDKFYYRLPDLLQVLNAKGYQFVKIDQLLK